jgi:hypothetical protein
MATPQPPLPPLPKYLQEPEMTQECWDIISSLPTQPSWVLGKGKGIVHEYQGFWKILNLKCSISLKILNVLLKSKVVVSLKS